MLKIIALWIFGALLLLQAIRIEIPAPPSPINPKNELETSQEIMSMLRVACYDCHSYETKMPWYGHVAPVSWEVKSHIKEGRKWLNFQEWNTYNDEKKQKIYKGIVKSINFSMPMPGYLIMHEEAKLTKSQRETIKKWAQSHLKEENR